MDKKFITRNIILDSGDAEVKRGEIRDYFNATYELYEKLFELLVNDEAFYQQPEPLRHPLIFYFGHTATFFINKLNISKLYTKRVNEYFESIFAIGVDEMSWDDLNPNNYTWPKVSEVWEYRAEVKQIINNLIDTLDLSLPIGWDSPWWVILMGIEHERIHLETSSVLFRQLNLKFLKRESELFNICNSFSTTSWPQNELIAVKGKRIVLGRDREHPKVYGWDNEFGTQTINVSEFKASKYLVSNGEYLEFVHDGGYAKDEYWEEEGLEWRRFKDAKHPTFWIEQDGKFTYRALNKELPLPLNWPVDLNYHEAKAFCNWKSAKDGQKYDLPTEAQWHAIWQESGLKDEPEWESPVNANINLEHFTSSCEVDRFRHGKFYDVIGNVWQWTNTPIHPFDRFKIHNVYDDFSVLTFDNRHNIIKGGSFITTGNEALTQSRYAFRRHFFQHAGFRYVVGSKADSIVNDVYESDKSISQYIEFHYGNNYFGIANFPATIAKRALQYTTKRGKALDIGCSVGRASFELAKEFSEVWGLDFSARFIKVGVQLQDSGKVLYEIPKEGGIVQKKEFELGSIGVSKEVASRCKFYQADASNLKPIYSGYDLVLALNLLDRLYEPLKFLNDIKSRINRGGVFVLASPYNRSEEFTPKERWLGGYYKDEAEVKTADTLKKILSSDFELIDMFEQEFAIRERERNYQHSLSNVQVWRRR